MQQRPMMPTMMTGMVRVGESSGQLDIMFKKVSDFYEDDVDVVVAQALKLLEPMLFVVLGVVVGAVLIAMYLPIFDIANTQTGG
jgi:type IV pilus assembly protein PilC